MAGNFHVDGTTLVVDKSTNRVGIKNDSPSQALDVTGSASLSQNLLLSAASGIGIDGAFGALNQVLASRGDGTLQWVDIDAISSNGTGTVTSVGVSGGSGLSVSGSPITTSGTITINIDESGIDHNSLQNYVSNEHVNHSLITLSAGDGLTGGGDITASRSFAVNGGTGVTANSTGVHIGQPVGTTDDVTFNYINFERLYDVGNTSNYIYGSSDDLRIAIDSQLSYVFDHGQMGIYGNNSTSTTYLTLYNLDDPGTAGEFIGIDFTARNAAGTGRDYARISGYIEDTTTGSEYGQMWFYTTSNGVVQDVMRMHRDGLVPGDDSTWSLGNNSVRWANLYVDDIIATANVDVGDDVNVTGDVFIGDGTGLARLSILGKVGGASGADATIQLSTDNSSSTNDWVLRLDASNSDKLVWRYDNTERFGLTPGGNVNISGTLDASGNIAASYFIGDGSQLTNIDESTIQHNLLDGFVANRHIDHTAVSILSGDGLTGGGTIDGDQTLTVVGGIGVTSNSTGVHIGQDVATTADVTFNSVTGDGSGLTNVTATGGDADTLDGLDSTDFVRSDGTAVGVITIEVNNDFILRDATRGTTNIIWRDYSAGALYIGTAFDVATFRSDLRVNTDSSYSIGNTTHRFDTAWIDDITATANVDAVNFNGTNVTVGNLIETTGGNIVVSGAGGEFRAPSESNRSKYLMHGSNDVYSIGMESGITYGALGDWGMTFQFNDDTNRGFWFGSNAHSKAEGAMSLTTYGDMVLANSFSVGYGTATTSAPSATLDISGDATISGNVTVTTDLDVSGNTALGDGSIAPLPLYVQHLSTTEGTTTFDSQTIAAFQRNTTSGYLAKVAIIAGTAGIASLDLGDYNNQDRGYVRYNNSGENLYFGASGVDVINVTSSQIQTSANLIPSTDSTYDLGTSTFRWEHIWSDEIAVGDTLRITANGNIGINTTFPSNPVRITLDDDDAANSFIGVFIDHNLTGSQAISGADYTHRALYIDVDSSVSSGNTTDEFRIWALTSDVLVDDPGDWHIGYYGFMRNQMSTADTCSLLYGTYNFTTANNTAGTISSTYGHRNLVYFTSAGTKTTGYGSANYLLMRNSAPQVNQVYGSFNEIETTSSGGGINIAYGVLSRMDINANTTVNTPYLFYGDYLTTGTITNDAMGVYITGEANNYFSANVAIGDALDVGGDCAITGALSKGSGSFKIDHPLPEKKNTHFLVHSFIEGPRADLTYRGKATVYQYFTVNLDEEFDMTEGTFEALNRNVQVFTTNESGWGGVRGSIHGNILTIEMQDPNETAEISWLVIGERRDPTIYESTLTDDDGRIITEIEKHGLQLHLDI